MGFREPFAAYNAANNVEAQVVANFLNDAGVEAVAVADVSQAGTWWLGLVPELHKPQVWIEQQDWGRAQLLLQDFEQKAAARRSATDDEGSVIVTCEECGSNSSYPSSQLGSVQNCPHCGEFVDVGEVPAPEGWDEVAEEVSDDPVNSDEN